MWLQRILQFTLHNQTYWLLLIIAFKQIWFAADNTFNVQLLVVSVMLVLSIVNYRAFAYLSFCFSFLHRSLMSNTHGVKRYQEIHYAKTNADGTCKYNHQSHYIGPRHESVYYHTKNYWKGSTHKIEANGILSNIVQKIWRWYLLTEFYQYKCWQ